MNLKINIKRPQITKEEIAANKNFGELLTLYKVSAKSQRPFYRSAWFYTTISAAAAVVVALFFYVTPAENKNTLSFINPPLQKIQVASSQYSMKADQGMTITYKTGSVVKIPPKAFVNIKGKPVEGKVDITYRELNEPIDFFLAGVPMNYDSAGQNYAFESAGMIEIHATQNGNEVTLSPEKELSIALASHQSGKEFSLYQLDNKKKQWVYRGQEQSSELLADLKQQSVSVSGAEGPESLKTDASATESSKAEGDAALNSATAEQIAVIDNKIEHAEAEIKKSEAALQRFEASRPFEPIAETKGHRRFSINVRNLKEFPEFAIYNDVMFQAAEESKNFDKNAYFVEWTDAKLAKQGENYILSLKSADVAASYIVRPVFEGESYIAAQKIYKVKLDEYQEALVEHKGIEGEKQQELTALTEVLKENREAEIARNTHKQIEAKVNPGNLTFHNFTVHGCGIWSLNSPTLFPLGAMINPRFTDEQGKELQFAVGKIYLVEKGRNVLFSFTGSPDKIGTISYNPEKQNMIWGITTDNKIAVFRYEDFMVMGNKTGNYTFKMHLSDVDLADESQVEYYLSI